MTNDAKGLVTSYTYDGENRQKRIQESSGALTTMTYSGGDGLRRTRQRAGGTVTTYVWDGSDYLGEVGS